MPANNPQAYIGLLLLIVPAIVYYFVINRDFRKSGLYLVAFFGSQLFIKTITSIFNINFTTQIFNTIMLMSIIIIILATSLALYLIGDKLELKNVGWLAGVMIVAQLVASESLKSTILGG